MPVVYTSKEKLDKMRPRIPKDVYQTPQPLADAVIDWLITNYGMANWVQNLKVLDPGAGNGVWGRAVLGRFGEKNRAFISGLDIRNVREPVGYDLWFNRTDFLNPKLNFGKPNFFNLIIGNPPFNQAEEFIWTGLKFLNQIGILVYLLPSGFLYTQTRGRGLFKNHPPQTILNLMQRPNFTGPRGESLGKSNSDDYSVVVWSKDPYPSLHPFTYWLDWKPE